MKNIIDTHCHYNLEPLWPNWQPHWHKAQESGVVQAVVVGTTLETSKRALEISQTDQNLFASVGIHPNNYNSFANDQEAQTRISSDKEFLNKLIVSNKPIAIGETGLDYYHFKSSGRDQASTWQKNGFAAQLELTQEHNLPVIIHVRDKETPESPTVGNAYWDLLEILKKYRKTLKQNLILHCASGPLNFIKEMINIGAYIGFDGNLTYPNAQHLREIFRLTPPNKRLIETDAPYLPPQEYRGKTCEPWMIAKTTDFIKRELATNPDKFLENTKLVINLRRAKT